MTPIFMYEPPRTPLQDSQIPRGSLLRGFAGGWGAMILGVVLASLPDLAYMAGKIDRAQQRELMALAWTVLFLPLLVLVVRHALRGRSLSVVGALLSILSAVLAFAAWLAYMWFVA